MTRTETAAEIGRGGLSLLEKWARDTLVTGAVLFSVFAILAGVAGDGGPTWLATGLVVGLAGIVLPFVAMKRWSGPTTWAVSLVCLVASIGVVVAVATR